MTLTPASEKTFAQIVPDERDQEAICNEVNRILGIPPSTENNPQATPVAYTTSNKG